MQRWPLILLAAGCGSLLEVDEDPPAVVSAQDAGVDALSTADGFGGTVPAPVEDATATPNPETDSAGGADSDSAPTCKPMGRACGATSECCEPLVCNVSDVCGRLNGCVLSGGCVAEASRCCNVGADDGSCPSVLQPIRCQ